MNTGFIAGTFDLLHTGHILTLEQCKLQCDYLIIGLQVDPSIERPEKKMPIQTVFERFCQLKACKYVDEIIPYETEEDLVNILLTMNINIRFNGSDHQNKQQPSEKDKVCSEKGIEIIYIKRTHNYSTSQLRERIRK